MSEKTLLSIVAPAFNEEGNLFLLYERLAKTFEPLDFDWELILVDDGSTDETAERIRMLHARDPRVRGVILSRNFGHEIASTAGLDAARGDAAVLMDADLQDPPETISVLIDKWREGYEVVCARRASREGESAGKKLSAFLFYRLMKWMVGGEFPADTGDFRLLDRKVLDAFHQCRERNRFTRALSLWPGFRQTVIEFDRASRYTGKTKYGLRSLVRLGITGIASFSVVPLRLATWIGLAVVLLSFVFIITMFVQKMMGITPRGYGFMMASIWFLGGVQCLLIGLLGEYIGLTYTESRQRPLYVVREVLGSHSDTAWPEK